MNKSINQVIDSDGFLCTAIEFEARKKAYTQAERANYIANITTSELEKLEKKHPGFKIYRGAYQFSDGSILKLKDLVSLSFYFK
jgi:hypothetical protein